MASQGDLWGDVPAVPKVSFYLVGLMVGNKLGRESRGLWRGFCRVSVRRPFRMCVFAAPLHVCCSCVRINRSVARQSSSTPGCPCGFSGTRHGLWATLGFPGGRGEQRSQELSGCRTVRPVFLGMGPRKKDQEANQGPWPKQGAVTLSGRRHRSEEVSGRPQLRALALPLSSCGPQAGASLAEPLRAGKKVTCMRRLAPARTA